MILNHKDHLSLVRELKNIETAAGRALEWAKMIDEDVNELKEITDPTCTAHNDSVIIQEEMTEILRILKDEITV